MGAPRLKLRSLSSEEEQVLRAKLADKQLRAKVHERYRLVEYLREGLTASAAARAVRCSAGKAEHWVHRFNESGFSTFEEQPNHPGRQIGRASCRERVYVLV